MSSFVVATASVSKVLPEASRETAPPLLTRRPLVASGPPTVWLVVVPDTRLIVLVEETGALIEMA